MHDAWTQLTALLRKLVEPIKQRVDQRAAGARIVFFFVVRGMSRTGMHHHSRRLVDHGEGIVFIDNVKWNVFRSGFERRRHCRAKELNVIAILHAIGSLLWLSVYSDLLLVDQLLHARS